MANKWKNKSSEVWKNAWNKNNLVDSLGSIGSGITGIVESAVTNNKIADTIEEEGFIDSVGNTKFGSGSFNNLLSDFNMNELARTNFTGKELRGLTTGQMLGNTLSGIGSGAIAGAQVGGPWGAVAGAATGLLGGLAGIFTGNSKARRKAAELNKLAEQANTEYLNNFNNAVINTQNTMFNNSLLNIAAKGGKIYIKPQNRGKFTEYCGGKVTSECIARGKKSSSAAVRKRAVFAENARRWHSLGGNLFEAGGLLPASHTNGGIFSNGITIIGNGGTHENNPFDGVQIGMDANGVPNMVEEGEVIWNDYVFSNRLEPSEEFKTKYKLKGNTFADAAKEIQKESEERPNDPISKRGLEDSMTKLMIEQEGIRQQDDMNDKRLFKRGGKVKLPDYVEVTEEPIEEDNSDLEAFWGAAKTPEQRITLMEMDPTNAYKKPEYKRNHLLRYAPVLGSAIAVGSDLLGNTNTPQYREAKVIDDALKSINPIDYTPIGDYLSFIPFDPNYVGNRLSEQAAAGRRAIVNQSVNPGMAISGLLALNKGSQESLAEAYRQGLEYNQAQRERVAGFNRETNLTNAEMAMRTALANKQIDELKFRGALSKAQFMRDEFNQASAARSANLTTFFDNLGAVGKESFMMDMIENNPALLYDWMGRYKNTSACGGKLNKKRRK